MEVFLDQEVHGTPSVIIAHQPLLQALVFTVQTTVGRHERRDTYTRR